MKILRILLCLALVIILSACKGKDHVYEYPDDEPLPSGGEIGDPCIRHIDCKSGLLCIDNVCSEPESDADHVDDQDENPTNDGDEPENDTDTKDDSDSDTNVPDTNPTDDDTDPAIPDEDETEDTDTQPDEEPYVSECGNGVVDEGEECDRGADNSDEAGIRRETCRTNCKWAGCGDGIKDNDELCDDGNRLDGDYCSATCQGITGYCGDGIEQTNEVCDYRNNRYCKEDCSGINGECGDGIKQSFEVCDNADPSVGNGEGIGAYCSADCKEKSGRCGDGIIQTGIEECDDGDLFNGTYGNCNYNCNGYSPYCGDGILQRSSCNGYDSNCVVVAGASEVCDDGNYEDGDYCSSDCQESFGACGDGKIQEGIEVCDKAESAVGEGEGIGVYCSDDCQTNYGRCGDGIIQEGIEECDYGDDENGKTDCDYGSFQQCKVCTKTCKEMNGRLRYCGDGTRQPNEKCDKADPSVGNGEGIGIYYCSDNCQQITGYCGDGIIQQNEVCDPAKAGDPNSPYCSSDCKTINGRCGDGDINGNEECDNGETGTNPNGNTKCAYGETGCEVCTVDCKKAAGSVISYCGNNGIDSSNGEICDDGQNNGKYILNSPGRCNNDCKGYGEGGFCGDGTLQRSDCSGFGSCSITAGANEMCDEGTNNGKTDCAYGETSCKVCTTSCTETDGNTAYCGDGIKNGSEACDDGNTADGDYCSADCKTVTGYCGDGTKQQNETCDNADPGIGNGEGIGIYYCSADCKEITGYCGDGTKQQNETCDEGTANNGHYQHSAPGHCNSDCKGKGEGGYCGDGEWQQNDEECEYGGNTNIYCDYGQTECQICTSSCTLEAGRTAYCSDGILQREDCTGYDNCVVTAGANEICDHGKNNGKYGGFCNSTCSGFTPRCRDGILQRTDCTGYENCVEFNGADEECDDGANNGKYYHDAPGYCNYNCTGHGEGGYCGDGTKQSGENCDSGTFNGTYGLCNNSCTGSSAKCGDGILHREDCTGYENCVEFEGADEECDDGSFANTYNHCDDTCSARLSCGDGILQREDCTGYENCVVTPGANETCDDGGENGNYGKCNTSCNGFNEGGSCGDGILQRADCTGYDNCTEAAGANEMCDSGTNNGKYSAEAPGYCNSDCSGFGEGGTCNDGIIQRADCTGYDNCVVTEGANEKCDDETDNGLYGKCNLTCSDINRCGDGIKQTEETCDQGFANGTYGNRCNANCNGYTGYCNDGTTQREDCTGYDNCEEIPGGNEECDDGTFNNGNYGHCNDSCSGHRTERCGDGILQRSNCTGYDDCVTVPGAYEECDDGDDDNGTFGHCDKHCEFMITYRCGDGKIQKAHLYECGDIPLCDENTTVNCCEVVRFEEGDVPETCDDGALNNTPDHCNSTCSGMTPYCGDGIIQRADCTGYNNCVVVEGMNEECDETGNNGKTDCNYGQTSCTLCSATCAQINGNTAYCGDGIIHRENCYGYANCVEIPGTYENCDEGTDNGLYYQHCDAYCTTKEWNGSCGDGITQKASEEECAEWISLDSVNRKLCDENTFSNCCKVVAFASGESSETCDEGDRNNGYHGHCNETCDGTSSCGDGVIGKDELCEPGDMEQPWPCAMLPQFQTNAKMISECNNECMPIVQCDNADSFEIHFFNTKQTLCYDDSDSIACPSAGSAFYGQSPQFTYKEQDYTVGTDVITEEVSKLTWQKATPASYDGCALGSSCTYTEALSYCSNLELGGYSDWRLPKALELPAIADFAADKHLYSGFENTNGSYWTAEMAAFSTSDGTVTNGYLGTARVKCVRSEEASCSACKMNPSVIQYSNTLITIFKDDNISLWYFDDLENGMDWETALAFCEGADNGYGINNLRLPTVNELISLINTKTGASFISGLTKRAWTSTTLNGNAGTAYVIDFATANLTTDTKDTDNIVICVE